MTTHADVTIAHYRLLDRIGEGGLGEVFRARDTKVGRTVALKMLPGGFLDKPTRRERFLADARRGRALSHPNIATLFDVGEHEGQLVSRLRVRIRPDAAPAAGRTRRCTRETRSISRFRSPTRCPKPTRTECPPRRPPSREHRHQRQGQRQAPRLRHGGVDARRRRAARRSPVSRCRARIGARSLPTCRPSRPSAARSMPGPMSSRWESSSTRC